ncbi:MAG TPA: KH domain-containing protein [Nevskiaceae bacterium]|nr:KH domain-containing protein [Nevskiaceae bacterium]
MSSIDQQFVEFIVKSLVSNPDAVLVERRIDEKGVLLELTVDPEDLGRVIGKRGATAQSLRTLLRALGTKNDARYNLKIVDNGSPAPGRSDDNVAASDDTSTPQQQASQKDDNTAADDAVADNDEPAKRDEPESNMVSKTRKELDDLDDLDI